MNKTLAAIAFVVFALATRVALCDSSEAETTAIRELERQQQDAWNRHDAKAYASLFSEDGDYAFVFRESVLTITDVHVKFPAPEMAIAHVRWTMVGAHTPEALPKPQQGIQTQLLQKQSGKWLIVAFQNTNALPETPFPQSPPTSAPQPSATPLKPDG